jgi:hypothetical protein
MELVDRFSAKGRRFPLCHSYFPLPYYPMVYTSLGFPCILAVAARPRFHPLYPINSYASSPTLRPSSATPNQVESLGRSAIGQAAAG